MAKIINGQSLPNIPWQEKTNKDDVIWRYDNNPIIDRNPAKGCARVYNSSVVPWNDGFIGVFRADHRNGVPQLHVGHSKDAINWEIDPTPISWVDEEGNECTPHYSYDPRLTKLGDDYIIVWCADHDGAVLGVGKTRDFIHFTRIPDATLPYNRNGVPFPRKINGKYYMLNRPSDGGHTLTGDIFISESPDFIYWGKHKKVAGNIGPNWWECNKIGAGTVPIETDEGWLLFYHGVGNSINGFIYSIGAMLLDINDPSKVLYRTNDFLLTPEMPYEVNGFVPNVCFPCSALTDADTGRIAIYYGAADCSTAIAFTTVDEIINLLKNQ